MNFSTEMIAIGESAVAAARVLMRTDTITKNKALYAIADALKANQSRILEANKIDVRRAEENNIRSTFLNRLALSPVDLDNICDGVRNVASLPDPVGAGEVWTRPNGLRIQKMSVPFGVIAMVYEARPNVTVDAATLCLKSGNACILRGGSEAYESNKVLIEVIEEAIKNVGLPSACIQNVPSTDREIVMQLMQMTDYVDLIIPRGGASLIKSVVENSKVPYIETGTGVCHAYVHSSADYDKAVRVVVNSKVDKPEVCNALETLLVDESIAAEFLPMVAEELKAYNVKLLGCKRTLEHIEADVAKEEDWATEHLDFILNVKVVSNLDEALEHIYQYSTKHSETIIAEDYSASERFLMEVDAAAVYVNTSTRFTDGGRFGFGAEIGISTQKMHARGPMGLKELTSIKYTIYGNGQIVSK